MNVGRGWPAGLALFCLTVLLYAPAMQNGFVFDDDLFLHQNEMIKAADGLFRFWFTTEPPDYFPLTSTTLWLEWRLWGDNPAGYHVVNVLLHAGSCVLLWRVLLLLGLPGAWLGALIFAVHPVNVESVAWITQRKNVLSMALYLGSTLLYLRCEDPHAPPKRPRLVYAASLGTFLLALLAKTSVAILPPVLLLCAWWRRRRIAVSDLRRTAPFFALALVLGLVTVWYQTYSSIGDADVRDDGLASRVAIAGLAVWFYLYKVLLPTDLSFVYPRWEVDAGSIGAYLPLALLLGTFALLWRYRQGRGRPLLFASSYYVLGLLPVLGFVNIYFMRYSLVSDHWQYTSMIAVAALAGAGLSAPLLARARPLAATLLVLALSALSVHRQTAFQDAKSLWEDTLAKNPSAVLALNNLGNELALEGSLDEAIEHYERGLAIDPDHAGLRYNLGKAYLRAGKPDLALRHYRRVIRLVPDYGKAHNDLGQTLEALGRIDEAEKYYEEAVRLKPDLAEAHGNLGSVDYSRGRFGDAVAHYREALRLRPGYARVHSNLGNALAELGRTEESVGHYRAALQLEPDLKGVSYNLGLALLEVGRYEEAAEQFSATLRSHPGLLGAHYNLGSVLLELGRFEDALAHYRAVAEAKPRDGATRLGMARSLAGVRRFAEAAEEYSHALRAAPESAQVLSDFAWFLATCPDDSVRDGRRAIQLADQAVRLTDQKQAAPISALAAAHAETGDFAQAVRWQQSAIGLAPPRDADEYRRRLEGYRRGDPARDAAATATSGTRPGRDARRP